MKVLIVEDEPGLAQSLKKGLTEEGYVTDIAGDGEQGSFMAITGTYDVIVVDWMLPKVSGIELVDKLRLQEKSSVPILMLTARGDVADRVKGLKSGADDYLVKPFAFEELLARLESLARRPAKIQATLTNFGAIEIDLSSRTVQKNGRNLGLSPREFTLLEVLVRHEGQVLSRDQILELVWGYDYDGFSNVVDVYIRYLRNKIGQPEGHELIKTVRGFGYKFSQ